MKRRIRLQHVRWNRQPPSDLFAAMAKPTHRSERRGAILIFAMMALLIVSMLGASLLRTVSMSHQQLQREALHVQAAWLAESGCARAVARLKAKPDYAGEIWNVPANQLSAERKGIVRIVVSSETAQRLIVATAEYPADSPTAIRVTKRLSVPLSTGTQ